MSKTWEPGEEGINPSYTGSLAEFDPAARAADSKSNASRDLLRNSENSALAGGEPAFGGASVWRNSVSGKNNSKTSGKGRGKLGRKKGGIAAMIAILCLFVGGGAFLGSSHALLAPAMEALMTAATDTQYSSYALRSARLTQYMLKSDGAVNTSWNGTKKYAQMTNRMQSRLAKQGIEVNGSGGSRTLSFDGKTISADDFMNVYRSDPEFRSAYTKAKRGRAATFFDNVADKIYSRLGLSRNLFSDYKQSGNSDTDADNFSKTMSPEYGNNSSTVNNATEKTVYEYEEDGVTPKTDSEGNAITKTELDNKTDLNGKSNNSTVDADTKAKSFVSDIASKVTGLANAGCMLMRIGSTISAVVAANEIYQSINYYMNYMENISKMKAGYGSDSAINEVLNELTTPVTAQFSDLSKTQYGTEDPADLETSISGAPVQANGMQMMLAYAPANPETTKKYSIERTMGAIATAIGMSMAQVRLCAGVQAAAAIVSIVTTVSTFGISTIGQTLVNVAFSAGISVAAGIALSFIVPTVAKILFTNIFETTTGIPAGELLARGSSAANTRGGRSGSGQSLASGEVATAYSRITQEVIAMDAEVDRLNRSPFDITSKNTFLGSIAYSLLPVSLTAGNAAAGLTSVNTLVRTASSAMAALTGKVSAASENSYMANFGECPALDDIGAVGDIYCNPVTATDPALIDIAPDDSAYVNALESQIENCDSNGNNCTIKENGDLAKYITFCANRDSPFGVVDANILGALEKGNSFTNAVPVVGDVLDILSSIGNVDNIPWATGEKCVNSTNNADWGTFRYYQRYIEDQRILEQIGAYDGAGERNPVTAYEEKYEREHPLDNSPAGYLARISGITIEDAETVIAIAEYYQYINDYDPATRIALDGTASEVKTWEQAVARYDAEKLLQRDDACFAGMAAVQPYYVVYADVRNRSHAA